jgi:hypothetical protein
MKPTLNEKFLAYLALLSGISLSIVAEYYSILGLTAIFAAAVIPVVIMGIALGLGKISATLWLKQNWKIAPWSIRGYLFIAIAVLMLITSMGIFGFLSKAHSDQNLVSGDVLAKISIYDEKIKVSKENIDANRKALKQLDEAVDQVMARSTDEKGADKAVAIRRSQQKDRARLLSEIETEQKKISSINEERAPIAAEVRKVEAEVGPLKYIAAFVYGTTEPTILERAVTWVIITLIVVFDPLAVILLLASQISFQNFREREKEIYPEWTDEDFENIAKEHWLDEQEEDLNNSAFVADVGEKPTEEEKAAFDDPEVSTSTVTVSTSTSTVEYQILEYADEEPSLLEKHPYLTKPFVHFGDMKPLVYRVEEPVEPPVSELNLPEGYIQNEEQNESNRWSTIDHSEYYQASQAKIDEHVDELVELVRNKKMTMAEVPEPLQHIIRSRV